MSSHPSGLRLSSYSASQTNNENLTSVNVTTKNMQTAPQQGANNTISNSANTLNKKSTSSPTALITKNQFTSTNSLSESDTDISTSTENLSMEQRYVLRHTPRIEPQGQENLQEDANAANENKGRFGAEQRFSSNASTDSTRYASSNRSLSEARNSIFAQQPANSNSASNRNSLKEVNSNRSSMDVSSCSYNTLIIHNEDNMYSVANREYPSPPPIAKKERPRSYGEQGMQEITEIPDDYLNQSHVLKHLAKEIKLPSKNRNSNSRDYDVAEKFDGKKNPKFDWVIEEPESPNKLKSKSQPDLSRLPVTDTETLNALLKENAMFKQQLMVCNMKVAKTQKLEEEVAKVYRVYEELVQSCDRREKLERVARMRLQENLQKVQALNKALKDQVDIFQSQLLAPSEHQILIAQLFTQNKELCAAKERQDIELAAQQETLQEQRTHIGILDTALTNAQRNIRRLEEELRKKQICIERLTQIHGANQQTKQSERRMRLEYETELSKDSNRSGSSTNSDSKWQLQEKNSQMMRLESEQRRLEELRQNASKLSLEKTQETDRIIAEAKHDKLRYLEEVHSAQRKVGDLQTHLKILESRLAEKDSLIRALQNQKISGSSFDSYNISSESFALHPLRYNSPSSFNVSNNSFNTTTNTLLDTNAYMGVSPSMNPYTHHSTTMHNALSAATYGQSNQPYNQSVVNLQSITIPGNYSPNSSNYSAHYDPNSNYMTQNSPTFNTSSYAVDNQYDEHMKKQIDDQLSKFETLQRGLCCFPGLSHKKPNQPLLSDEVSVLSTNNSDAFLQKLAHLDKRERERQDQTVSANRNKAEEIILLEKQGRCSQKTRGNPSGNLAQVTQTVGQNMTDISNIGNTSPIPTSQGINALALPPKKERGNSLPPSALPRPPRSLKPPRKIDYDRLSDSELKKRSETPPKESPQRIFELKTSSLKRNQYGPHEYSPGPNNFIKETLSFPKGDLAFKRKDYGAMDSTDTMKFGLPTSTDFSKPDFTSTKTYQRLEDGPKSLKLLTDSNSLKRSFLPGSSRKINILAPNNCNLKQPRELLNSNGMQSSIPSPRGSPMHMKTDSSTSHLTLRLHSKTPPKYLHFGGASVPHVSLEPPTSSANSHSSIRLQPTQSKTSLPIPTSSASLPPKPVDNKSTRRGPSISRNGENRYRIQF